MDKRILTEEEKRAVSCLERLAKRWPKTICLVLRQSTREVRVALKGEVEGAYDLAHVDGVVVAGLKVDSHS